MTKLLKPEQMDDKKLWKKVYIPFMKNMDLTIYKDYHRDEDLKQKIFNRRKTYWLFN